MDSIPILQDMCIILDLVYGCRKDLPDEEKPMDRTYIRIHPSDNTLTALEHLPKGTVITLEGRTFHLLEDIPGAHKFALDEITPESDIIKYGCAIGKATGHIRQGAWIHTHNIKTRLEGLDTYTYTEQSVKKIPPERKYDTFLGYRRKDGCVGTRNELWIIPTVSCVNHTAEILARKANERFGDRCDGIFALPHNTGCSQLGDDATMSQRILAGITRHPNAGGVLLLSLGCENNDLPHFLPVLGPVDETRVKTMVTQEVVGDEMEAGMLLVESILSEMVKDVRQEVPVSSLVIGLKCGGSDAFSGLTANPLSGRIADRVVEHGGSAILTEVPEMFGAEHFLMERADSKTTFEKIVSLINSFKSYYLESGLPIYENPSPGNKAGGITTLEEKSLGNIQKSGDSPITDTLTYGEQVTKPGINLLEGPGNDNVSITNLLASGAQMLLFTTGRGNPLSSMIPTIKISSNTRLAHNKPNWIDFDAGTILEGTSFEEACDSLWKLFIDIASGKQRTKSELSDYRAIMIFKHGVLL